MELLPSAVNSSIMIVIFFVKAGCINSPNINPEIAIKIPNTKKGFKIIRNLPPEAERTRNSLVLTPIENINREVISVTKGIR